MGSVYLASHEVLGRRAAVKVLLPEFTGNAELVSRFFREARATAQLRHHAFVEIFDSGRLGDGSAYLVMEYLRGENLAAYLRRVGALPVDDALAIARDIAEGVGFAHAHGIIHRDLKPDNVFLTVNAGEPGDPQAAGVAVKILDFGIAKLMGEPDRKETASRTRAGAVLGTPLYMAPEQCRGSGQIDHRADLYSFGCIVHEILCGLPPFPLEGFGEILSAHLAQPPPPLRTLRRDVPDAVEHLVLTLLSKRADDRPPDMAAIAAAIDSIRVDLGGTSSVASLPVRAPDDPAADGPFAAPDPSYGSRPRQGGSGSGLRSGPGRTPAPLPRTTPAPPPLLRTTPAPHSMRRTPAPADEPRAEISAGGTQLLPTSDDAPRSRTDSSAGQRRGRSSRASVSTLRGTAGELERGRGPRQGGGAGRTAAIVAVTVAAAAAVVIAVVKLTSAPAAPPPETTPPAAVEAPPPPPRFEPPPPPPRAPPAAEPAVEAPPPATATVVVKIVSDPPGASVIDPRTGNTIGRTPFAGALPHAEGSVTLSVRKSGYRPKDVSVSLDRDSDLDVKLERKSTDNDYRKL